jgi:hypothetical protein
MGRLTSTFLAVVAMVALALPATAQGWHRHRSQPTSVPVAVSTATPIPPPVVALPAGASLISKFQAPNAYPNLSWVPYAINSVWNTPIGSNFQPDPNSSTYQRFYTAASPGFKFSASFGYSNQTNQYQHPIYFGRAGDPEYSVHCLASWSSCDFGSKTFRIPSYAIPAGGTDAHLTSIDTTNNTELDCWSTSPLSGIGGTLTAQACGYGPVTGSGLVFGQTAAGFAQWAGVVRDAEWVGNKVSHALFLVAPCTNNNATVYPSVYRSSTDTQCVGNQGAPYGERFRLNMSHSQILALGVPASHLPVLFALSDYGAYIGDTNGNWGFSFQTEADSTYTSAKYSNPLCPTNGAPCTPLTAYENSIGNPDWDGSRYTVDISHDLDWGVYGQWLTAPAQ